MVDFLRPYRGKQFVQVHLGSGEWLDRARNFTGAHVVVECGGYGYVAVNSSGGPIDLGGGPTCCFGRGGPVLYANSTRLHLREARRLQADDASNVAANATTNTSGATDGSASGDATADDAAAAGDAAAAPPANGEGAPSSHATSHTGSQWVIIDRSFATYLVRDARSLWWQRAFERRFLPDESFVQTVLMHSPHRPSLVNHNMRYIYWPHYDGDPASYWVRMGHSFIGGPQVVNSSAAPAVLRSPYMFARKVDPSVDAGTVRLWDEWMRRKLAGWRPPDQETLGGAHRNKSAALERAPPRRTAATVAAGTPPRAARPAERRVRQVVFEDGSACECSPGPHRCTLPHTVYLPLGVHC